jgi:hypothetical protein
VPNGLLVDFTAKIHKNIQITFETVTDNYTRKRVLLDHKRAIKIKYRNYVNNRILESLIIFKNINLVYVAMKPYVYH